MTKESEINLRNINQGNRLRWMTKRYKFYKNDSILAFIKDYFDVKDGVRCIAAHPIEYPDRGRVQYEYNKTEQRMFTFSERLLTKYNCLHSFMWIFDHKVLGWVDQNYSLNLYRSAAVGINAILEIDSPYESDKEGAKRLDVMNYIEDMNNVIRRIDRVLVKLGEKYNILFSGNGIYIILEGYYPRLKEEVEKLGIYKQNFVNLFENKKYLGDLREDVTKVHIDNAGAPWNDYMKIPWTFHEIFKNRVSIPLGKGDIVKEDLEYFSNAENIIKGDLAKEIIKRANWEKLW